MRHSESFTEDQWVSAFHNLVMPALVAGIHVLTKDQQEKTWMAGTSPGHDEKRGALTGKFKDLENLAAFPAGSEMLLFPPSLWKR